MAVILYAMRAEREQRGVRRIIRDRTQVLDTLNDDQLVARYRFPRRTIFHLTDTLRDSLERQTARSYAIPAHIQILVTLRFLAKGEYLSENGDIHGISIASVSRIVHSVCNSICNNLDNIKFPRTNEEMIRIKEGFYNIAAFPNVIGAIDGTLIPIQGMSGLDEPQYVCRKGFHAINVQAVVDNNLRFTNTVIRWPGSTHDSFILQNSCIPDIMENLDSGWLLGDSGYPLKKWLMTPILGPLNDQQHRYKSSHIQTRNTVERAFGVLKSRFRCLHKTGGSLQFQPRKCVKLIETAFRLHNLAIEQRVPLLERGNIEIYHDNIVVDINYNNFQANAVRDQIVQRF